LKEDRTTDEEKAAIMEARRRAATKKLKAASKQQSTETEEDFEEEEDEEEDETEDRYAEEGNVKKGRKSCGEGICRRIKHIRMQLRWMVRTQVFYWTVITLVFLNTACVASEHYGQPQWFTDFLSKFPYIKS